MLKLDVSNIINYSKVYTFLLMALTLICKIEAQHLQTINLSINDSNLLLIKGYQKKAIKEGYISKSSKKWMKVTLHDSLGDFNAKARIKGDWLDHIKNDKKSFRVKVKDSTRLVNGVKTFSIQDPVTRSYIKEWLLHKVLEDENILTTLYDFVRVRINGQYKGVYAFEQHFDKYLLENQQRREAPILKFDEDGFWQVMKNRKPESIKIEQNHYTLDVANIKPFKKNKTHKDSLLNLQFNKASKLISEFRYLNPVVINLMDKEKYAQFFALTDIFQNYHALNWINLRFYLNPLSGKIEPVVYDGYTNSNPIKWNSTPIMGYIDAEHDTIYNLPQALFAQFFNDSTFQYQYYFYLNKYTQTTFLDKVFTKYEEKIDFLITELTKEFSDYKFEKTDYYAQAELVKSVLDYGKNLIEPNHSFVYYSMWETREKQPELKEQYPLSDTLMLSKMALKAQYVNDSLYIVNSHPKAITLNNYITVDGTVIDAKSKAIKSYNPIKGPIITAVHLPNIKYVNYTSCDNGYRCKITKKSNIPYRNHIDLDEKNYLNYFKISNNRQLTPKTKTITINSPIRLPENYELLLPKGTQLNFVDKGSLIVKGNFIAEGTEKNPIKIKGKNRHNGILVSSLKKVEVTIRFASFSTLGNISTNTYTTTGGVTFYNANCNISNCTFRNGLGEDMLNIVGCNTTIANSYFENAKSDALDIDYGKGKILECNFTGALNDNIDFSNTTYLIENTKSSNAKDKAISCGEKSKISIINSTISNSLSGLVVKDNSVVVLSNSEIKNCISGVKVFQKKVAYRGGHLTLSGVIFNQNELNQYKDNQSIIVNN